MITRARPPKVPGSGRKKGTPNKLTLERKQVAEAMVRSLPDAELAKDVLLRLIKIAEGAASITKPKDKVIDPATGRMVPDPNDPLWDRFGQWFDRILAAAKEGAKYQSPQLRALLIEPPSPPAPEEKRRFTLSIFDRPASEEPIKVIEQGGVNGAGEDH